jgi:diguanylate cyclase (GGDEF)-like protein
VDLAGTDDVRVPSTPASTVDVRWDRAPCALLTLNAEGVILDVNDLASGWLERSPTALRGVRFSALLDDASRDAFDTRLVQITSVAGAWGELAFSLLAGDGARIPVVAVGVLDTDGEVPLVRLALTPGSERERLESELARVRRSAEASEARVRILQDVSDDFGVSVDDQEVADSVVRVAREAFSASEVAVHLYGADGTLTRVAGTSPVEGAVAPIPELRDTRDELVIVLDDARTAFPELATALEAAGRRALSIAPLAGDGERLGVVVCFFETERRFDAEFFDLQRALGRQATQTLTRLRLQRELEYQALRDPLTGVFNSQTIEQRLGDALADAKNSLSPLAVIFVDVDEFKSVNDTFGHVAGDHVLRTLAHRLGESVREDDVIGRVGGDEFIAICTGADARVGAGIAERIRAHSRDAVPTAAGEVRVSVSVGLASFHPGDVLPTADQLLMRADAAMYVSKGAGKDRVSVEERVPSAP